MKKSDLLGSIYNDWNKRLKTLGVSRKEFCERSGISYSTYKQLKNPTIRLLDRIENALRELEA